MLKKEHFYTENNKTKRYAYCSLCGAGPFKENDFEHIKYICGDKQKLHYCHDCNLHHRIKKLR